MCIINMASIFNFLNITVIVNPGLSWHPVLRYFGLDQSDGMTFLFVVQLQNLANKNIIRSALLSSNPAYY